MTGPKDREKLSTGFGTIFDSLLAGKLHTVCMGEVTSFDAGERTVSVQPVLRRQYKGETESRILPIENDLPVVYPGSAGFALEFELEAGDEVVMLTSERAIDTWMESGGVVEVGDPRRFDLSDAVVLAGITTKARSKSAVEAGITLRKTDDSVAVKVQDGQVTAKVGDMDFEVTSSGIKARPTLLPANTDVQAYALTNIPGPGYVSLPNHVHNSAAPGSPTTTPLTTPGPP